MQLIGPPGTQTLLTAKARVGMLVLSHIHHVTEANLTEVRRYYSGPIVVGYDFAHF